MRKFLILILSGAAGYMFYPALAPILFGIKAPEEPEVTIDETPLPEKPKVVEKIIPQKPKEVEKPVVPEPMVIAEEEKPAQLPKEEEPEEPAEPDLTSTDFELIINEAVENGKYIDFRKNNIISWKLLKQNLTRTGDDYQGEITVEIGNLFGKSTRKAQVTIANKKVSQWIWTETE